MLELHNGDDNRLTDTFIKLAVMPALDAVERDWRNGWRAAQEAGAKDKEKASAKVSEDYGPRNDVL